MATVKTYFNDMRTAELVELVQNNYTLNCKLRELADDCFTQWEEADFFRHCPARVEDYGRGYLYQLDVPSSASYAEQLAVLDWIDELAADYALAEEVPDKVKRARRYLEVMREDCYSIWVKDKDLEYMEKAVGEILSDLLAEVSDAANSIREQFDDVFYMLDALACNDMLDDWYITEDGRIYRERGDELVA